MLKYLFTLLITAFSGFFGQQQANDLPLLLNDPQQQQFEAENAVFSDLVTFRDTIRYYRYEHDEYPATFEDFEAEYLTLPPEFDRSLITYTRAEDRSNYELCHRGLPDKEVCLDQISFFPGDIFSPDSLPQEQPLSQELYLDTLYSIRGAQSDYSVLYQALPTIIRYYQADPAGVEFNTLYGTYVLQEGYSHGNIYHQDALDAAGHYLAQAEAKEPEGLYVLDLKVYYLCATQKCNAATQTENKIAKLYPDELYAQLMYTDMNDELMSKIETLLAEKPHPYLVEESYRRLINHYGSQRNKTKELENLTALAEYTQHPWDWQNVGHHYRYVLNQCVPAIEAFEKAQAVGEVGLVNIQLRDYYVDCGTTELNKGNLELAKTYADKAVLIPGKPPKESYGLADVWEAYAFKAKVHQARFKESGDQAELRAGLDAITAAEESEEGPLYVLEPLKKSLEKELQVEES